MIIEKTTREDLILYEILRHPILCGEFHRNLDVPENGEEWEYAEYQREYIGDFNHFVSLCCGRSVGKTVALSDYILWLMINNVFPTDYIVYTVPNKVHLEPVFFSLVKALRNNTLLKHYIEAKKGINSANYTIKLLNYSQLICRIAGQSGTGANVVGLHTPIIILDESGYYPQGTFNELQPALNSWQKGFKLFVSGVPTGIRESNINYYADEVSDDYSKHRTSAHQNPRYTDIDEQRNIKRYGGTDSEEYVHFVLGRHGAPTFAVFDRRLMQIDTYPIYKTKVNGIDLRTYGEVINKLALIPPVPKNDMVIMGVDLGYTAPTAVVILYENKGIIKTHARIQLTKVKYPIQEKIIDYLDTKFERPSIIGIDAGNEQGMIQHLLEDDCYVHKNYKKRINPVKFGAWLVLGITSDDEEIKVKTKPYATSLLQEYTNAHKLVYSSTDLEMVTELERMTYTKNPRGDIVYRTLTPRGGKRGADHFTAAMLCAALSYYMLIEGKLLKHNKPRLASSRWV